MGDNVKIREYLVKELGLTFYSYKDALLFRCVVNGEVKGHDFMVHPEVACLDTLDKMKEDFDEWARATKAKILSVYELGQTSRP